jgi:hypothetical protein
MTEVAGMPVPRTSTRWLVDRFAQYCHAFDIDADRGP